MANFETIYTKVQIRGPFDEDMPLKWREENRIEWRAFSYWLGKIGHPQVGPTYLGWEGLLSLLFGFVAIEIIGLNMWASVNWDPIAFVRNLPFLTLDPPAARYGLNPIVPLKEGGWWILAGFTLTTSILLWWVRGYRRARALGMGTHVSWAFASAIFLYLSLGYIRPLLMGNFSEAPPFGIITHLNWTATISVL
ncbi:MAG: photosynthetic reaction center subunit M, partial [Parafilimonas terrae]|nr:photosynthetic reaction center subunit M [Parafilimonas terrae]